MYKHVVQQLKINIVRKLIFVFLILAVSCKSLRKNSNVGIIGNSEYYILEFNPNETYPLFVDAEPTTLSHEEIIFVENVIKGRVEKTISEWRSATKNEYDENKYQYDRQYVAALNEEGEKLIWINFFCNNDLGEIYDLRRERTNTSDGGRCYFEIKVNLTNKEIIGYKYGGLG